ncbi:uncharacterized protein C18orf19 homolog B-like isoform X2 [Myxocyprinus asiaticus]|nr:uncharacterized protein C18orf19 homolog B-like isoform X2 [Myxocyprinus asiaticus]XP_051577773.1 uncharacterized protein C18orf19 homolog B-like isoform X2 [Myxocyprinus asiaticus]XP_051577774.1 uncharacterized protein C18orf19 homolog B-like isoform X2 [Myxocyprinus asiaticus]
MQRLWAPVTLRQVVLLRSAYLGHTWNACELPVSIQNLRCFRCTSIIRTKESHKTSAEEDTPLNPPQSLAGTEGLYKAGTGSGSEAVPQNKGDSDPLQDKSIGLFQRFKKTFKQYGKVMVPVHIVTSTVWFGSFYYAAMKGVNVIPFLEFIGLPDWMVGILRDSQGGYALTAYAMYKLATPARYTVTMGGTSLSVQCFHKHGYLSTPPPVKEYLQDKMEETRERLTEKMEETKERFSEKMEETKELLSGRMEETKERLSETKDKFSEKLQETKDKMSLRKKTE